MVHFCVSKLGIESQLFCMEQERQKILRVIVEQL